MKRLRLATASTRALGPLLALLVALSGAGWVTAAPVGAQGEENDDASIYLLHCTPDAPTIDVYVDGDRTIRNLAYGRATEIFKLDAGEHRLAVTETGSDPSQPIVERVVRVEAGKTYAIATVGLLAEIEIQTWPLDLQPVVDGSGTLSVVNASPDAETVNIALADGDDPLAGAGFPEASDPITIPAGTYNLEVRVPQVPGAVEGVSSVPVREGTATTIYVLGLAETSTLEVIRLTQTLNLAANVPNTGTGSAAPPRP